MALGKANDARSNITYVSLSRSEDAGFKRSVNTVDENGAPKKGVETYPYVTGIPIGFSMKQELVYEVSKELRAKGINPMNEDLSKYKEYQKKYVSTVLLRDPETTEVIGVNFDLHDSLGGKVVGMLNSARLNTLTGQDMNLRTFYAPPNSKYNDKPKGRSSVNMRVNGSDKAIEDIRPAYLDEAGEVVMDKLDPTRYAGLPMGEESVDAKGKSVWTFAARDEMISLTALAVLDHFKKPADIHAEHHGEGGIDLDEAAHAASAPHG